MIDKQVTVSKEDIGGKEVEGAELKVVDKDGNVVDSWTSTNEKHPINNLVEGETYTLYEDYAPDTFVISNKIEFTVTTDKRNTRNKNDRQSGRNIKSKYCRRRIRGSNISCNKHKNKKI